MNGTLFTFTLLFFFFVSISSCHYFFFFSSRRRHTRCLSDWSSDVCSSDLQSRSRARPKHREHKHPARLWRSEERRVGKGVDLGGRRIIKKKKKKKKI